ncbi:MAG: SIMPL domain-containing protein [Candidatus Methanofastidiosum sp.]|nr:SIMPL domain-containing protein [Methanofastidiosum sp.]
MEKEIIYGIVAIILALGLVTVAVLKPATQGQYSQLQVTGTALIKEAPDQAIIYVYIETRNDTALLSQQEASRILGQVIQALEKEGIPSDKIQTDTFSIYPEYYYPRDSEPTLLGYRAVYGLKVITTDTSKVGNVVDASIKAGANRINNIEFGLSDAKMQEVKIKIIKEAVKVAQVKANAMAEAGNFKLGKITYMNESSYNIVPYNRVFSAVKDEATSVPPEDVEISATVSITYKI